MRTYQINFCIYKKKWNNAVLFRKVLTWSYLFILFSLTPLIAYSNMTFNPVPVSFSSDGKIMASVGYKAIRIWRWDILKGYGSRTIKIWDFNLKKIICILKGHRGKIYSLVFSPDNKVLASIGSKTIKFWDIESGKQIKNYQWDGGTLAFDLSPIKMVFAFSKGNVVKLIDLNHEKQIGVLQGHKGNIRSISFSPDGKLLAVGSSNKLIKLWNVEFGTEVGILEGHKSSVETITFSHDGKMLASGSSSTKLWDIKAKKEICTLPVETAYFYPISLSPNNKVAATTGPNNEIKIWDITSCEERNIFSSTNKGSIYSIVFAPNGNTLAISRYTTQTIQLLDIETGTEIISWNINE